MKRAPVLLMALAVLSASPAARDGGRSTPAPESGAQASGSSRGISVVSAGPTGEIASLEEANEIRVIFSEPMVALGRIPQPVTAPFFRITPHVDGTFRWSGTTTLMFTPARRRPLPLGTRFEVTIDAGATAVSGRRIETPYTFSFVTPTVRLLAVEWMRKSGRYTDPVTIALRLNQPVRPAHVAAHVSLAFESHAWAPPVFTPAALDRLKSVNPQAIAAFNEKVARAARAAAANTRVLAVPAASWDKKLFPPSADLVVLETTTPVPPDSWIELVVDAGVTGLEGKETPPGPQSKILELEPTFFVSHFHCSAACNPDDNNPLHLRGEVKVDALAHAVEVIDISRPGSEVPVARAKRPLGERAEEAYVYDTSSAFTLEDLGFVHPPARTFAVSVDASLQLPDGQTLGYDWQGVVENWHQVAFTSFGDGHGVWEASGGSKLPFYARNFQDVRQWASAITPSGLMPAIRSLEERHFTVAPAGEGQHRRLAPVPDRIQSYGLDLAGALGGKPTGLVWAAVEDGTPIPSSRRERRERPVRSTVVQVTNLGITVKHSPLNTLVFVTRLNDGAPVAGAEVQLVTLNNEVFWTGSTDGRGIAVAPDTRGLLGDPARSAYSAHGRFTFIATARKGEDVAYVANNWAEGIEPWQFGSRFDPGEADPILRGTVFTDRGVYRLGEEVHFKAILREDAADGVKLLSPAAPIHVSVTDSQGRVVDNRVVKLNEWSAAEWTLDVPPDGPLGHYSFAASLDAPREGGRASAGGEDEWVEESRRWRRTVRGSFLVAAYRRPEFRVDVALDGGEILAGEKLGGTIAAKYLFGAPMARRPVRWSFTRVPVYSAPRAVVEAFEAERFYFGGDYEHESQVEVAADEATLDPRGGLALSLQTAAGVDRPYRYILEGEVEDLSRQRIAGRAAVEVHPAPWYLGVRLPDYFVDPAKGLDTAIVAAAPDGRPVAGVPVTVSLLQVQWQSARRAEGGGFYSWETQRVEKELGSWTLTSAEKAVPLHVPLEHGGYYQVVARASDDRNHATKTTIGFYALGSGYTAWQRYDHNRIELVPEKKKYRPGETARIMIKSPWEQATALLTTEREGIRTQRQFTLASTQQSVTVPIAEADIPNLYVSVLLVKGRTKAASGDTAAGAGEDDSDPGKPSFRLGYVELEVEDASKRLSVTVRSNKDEYRPSNSGKVDVEVRDAAGKPARAEVTLWAVDYGVLSLTGFRTPDVLGSVYIRKALQVATADSRQRIVSRRVLTPKGETEGGGGGAEQGAGTMRRDFRVLAFWLGSVATDGNGRASVDVKLPESLTTYRIMAVAGDKASRFGGGESEVRVNKPVMLRAAFPRFLAVGDTGFFGAVVNSQLKTGGSATVTIRSLDPAVLEFPGAASQGVEVGPEGAAEVRFAAQARALGRARVRMTVKLGNETDAFEEVIPVEILHSPETVAAYGQTTGEAAERLAVPAGVAPGFGGLRVDLSSTALVGLNEGARFLVEYPYGCAEQHASSTLALLLVADLGEAFKLAGVDPANARARAEAALRQLARFQCDDGAFAYWPGACWSRSEYLTSYILHVLNVARSMKYAVDASMTNRALDYLERRMGEPPPVNESWWPSYTAWQAFAAKVLVEAGRNQDSNVNRLYGYLDRMPVFAVAYLHDALLAKGEQGERLDELQRRISNAILPEGGSAHVEELSDPYLLWFWNSNVRTTAIVLGTLVKRAQGDALVRPMVRWLMNARKNGRWGNTQENAWAMGALVAYHRKFEAEAPDFSALVTLGAGGPGAGAGAPRHELARETFEGRSTATRAREVPMADLLAKAPAASELDLRFSREGTGTLFYGARLRYTSNELFTEGMDQGFLVERSYERLVEPGVPAPPPSTTFQAGELVRVTLTFTLPKERRYVAVTDPLPAGFEPVESWFATTASDLAREQESGAQPEGGWRGWWQRGGFDHVERRDDRVMVFATRLSEGRHVFSYVARATTAGTFRTAPAHAEEMYEPEVFGRTATAMVEVRR